MSESLFNVTLIAAGVGAVGSIVGALSGAALGYRLGNSKPNIDIVIDRSVWMYYPESSKIFSMYVPMTVINEGSKAGIISDLVLTLTSSTKQSWTLRFCDFAIDNSDSDDRPWGKGKDARPILCSGKTGVQYFLRFVNNQTMSNGVSDVEILSGEYTLSLDAVDQKGQRFVKKKFTLNIGNEAKNKLAILRQTPADTRTYKLPVNVA
ncbi:hypothetical protein NB471_21330 [Vibrio alginolyticus]|uniref:hypothetical protein n=1 Tax=Vibrio alginolyticus TaxID=663 RepID=UPI001F193216|nr:hypothetical protein [Vibrio alginolyticus]MCE9824211.1 hypothetical protein [Vibrio alginolyticus]MCR9415108.1 hypothetical protein [Vibrio alginolyticus]